PPSTPFPYATLFRSCLVVPARPPPRVARPRRRGDLLRGPDPPRAVKAPPGCGGANAAGPRPRRRGRGPSGHRGRPAAQLAAAAARASFHAESVVGARTAPSPAGTIVVSSSGVPK